MGAPQSPVNLSPNTMSNSDTHNPNEKTLVRAVDRPVKACTTRLPRSGHSEGRRVRLETFEPGRKKFIKIRVNEKERAALTRLGSSEGGISALIRRHLLGQALV